MSRKVQQQKTRGEHQANPMGEKGYVYIVQKITNNKTIFKKKKKKDWFAEMCDILEIEKAPDLEIKRLEDHCGATGV